MPFLVIISRKDNEDVAVLLPPMPFHSRTLLLQIANPVTPLGWTANPAQQEHSSRRHIPIAL
ncbi:MAG: hypothetical protein IKK04_05055, partial [Bacteroidales bacterium]|nr:hypothetical protein [Bacteroidales bacterium]